MKKDNNPLVCFFDSGIGGIGVLSECVRRLPKVDFTYFADNYCVPYGNMSRDELLNKVDKIFGQIDKLKPSAAVVACNTVTAQCIDLLRKKYNFEIIGMQPAVKPAFEAGGSTLVLATNATAGSSSLKELLKKYGGRAEVFACAGLAAYIEEHIENIPEAELLSLLPEVKADNVVLGCTHYIFVKDVISRYYNCRIFDGVNGTAERLCEKLGISDHQAERGQKITFVGGDIRKNRSVFNAVLKSLSFKSHDLL